MNEPLTDERLARGISKLPDLEPPDSAWTGIEARLAAPRARPGRVGYGAAALALVAIVGVLVRAELGPTAVPAVSTATAPPPRAAAADASLDRRSSDLEQLLAALPPPSVGRASTGLTTTLLEDGIAQVDERLSLPQGGALSAETTRALKRQRVVLLDSLVRVRYASAVAASL